MHLIQHFSQLIDDYDIYLVDQWGVLHNGQVGFSGAFDALNALKQNGKTVIILSNSSRPYDATATMLDDLGFPAYLYDSIITSGTDFQDNILNRHQVFYQNLGKKCFTISWERDLKSINGQILQHAVLDDMPLESVDDVMQADFILCAGINRQATLDNYRPLLQQAKQRNLPMVCINPDKVSVTPDGRLELCPGAIAELYEQEYQGNVSWHGKPYAPIYQAAERIAECKIDKRVLAIGDSIHHDIQGIKQMGGDGLFITGGIAWQEIGLAKQYDSPNLQQLQVFYQKHQIFADYAQPKLSL